MAYYLWELELVSQSYEPQVPSPKQHLLHEVVMINELIHMKPLEQILVHSEHVYVFAHIII